MANPTADQIRFQLPKDKGDVYLTTWKYIVNHMTEFFVTATALINSQNESLEGINRRVDEWLEEQGGGETPNP